MPIIHKIQFLSSFKDTPMRIWKSANIFVFMSKQYNEDFTIKHLLLSEICAREIYEKFVYKHSETIEYVKKFAYFLRNLQTLRTNNSRIPRIKNAKFSGYCFYMNTNIWGDFQICVRVSLTVQYFLRKMARHCSLRQWWNVFCVFSIIRLVTVWLDGKIIGFH